MSAIKLSILMPSFNKEQYIATAIDSVLNQKTNFDLRLVITDDGSTDKTLDIVNGYIEKHPGKIVLLPSEKNQGLLSNIIKAYEYLVKNKSEYFCCLDADDFLTDDTFYQKAIDFLDCNPEFNIYASKTSVLYENGKEISNKSRLNGKSVDSTFEDMLNDRARLGNTISSVFRNCVITQELINKLKGYVGDNYVEHSFREDDFRNRIHLEHSKAHFVFQQVGTYRSTRSGLFQGSNDLKRILLKIQSFIDMYYFFDKKYPEFIDLALKQLDRIDHEAVKSDLNKLFKYNNRDLVQLCRVFSELSSCNMERVCAVIERVRGRSTNFIEKIFSIKNYDANHNVVHLLGLKIKTKKNPTLNYWQQRVKRYKGFAVYNTSHSKSELEQIDKLQIDIYTKVLKKYLNGTERNAIDYGCGCGCFENMLSELVQDKVFAFDPMKKLIKLAPKNKKVRYRVIKKQQTKLPNNSVDLIFVSLVLGGIVDKDELKRVVQELKRIASKNALVFLVENTQNCPDADYWHFRDVEDYIKLFDFANLKEEAHYYDLDEKISILVGRVSDK